MSDEMPASLQDMTVKDDRVHKSRIAGNSIVALGVEALAGMTDNSIVDPTSVRRGHMPGGLSGVADPMFGQAGFAIGDRFYHREKKKEGKIVDLTASGKAIVKFDGSKETNTVLQSNLVKL